MTKKVTEEVIRGFIRRLEECAADAVEIMELTREGKVDLEPNARPTADSLLFDVACATRDITQMGITVSRILPKRNIN